MVPTRADPRSKNVKIASKISKALGRTHIWMYVISHARMTDWASDWSDLFKSEMIIDFTATSAPGH